MSATPPAHSSRRRAEETRSERSRTRCANSRDAGQSVWLDYIRRKLLDRRRAATPDRRGRARRASPPTRRSSRRRSAGATTTTRRVAGRLKRGDSDADGALRALAIARHPGRRRRPPAGLRPDRRRDGYVSLEVSPHLANDTDGTIAEARRLWSAVDRPNLMIKVPGTPGRRPGHPPADRRGHQRQRHAAVLRRRLRDGRRGVHRRPGGVGARGGDPARVASVASFFVSRIDTAVDAQIDARLKASAAADDAARLQPLRGKVAIANAKLAYQRYQALFAGPRWEALADRRRRAAAAALGLAPATKNPAYRDVLYVEELIGPDTVNTMPPADHRRLPRPRHAARRASSEDVDAADDDAGRSTQLGISLDGGDRRSCSTEGVQQFAEPFDEAARRGRARKRAGSARATSSTARPTRCPPASQTAVDATLEAVATRRAACGGCGRGDASLWTGADEANWLGWLGDRRDSSSAASARLDSARATRCAGEASRTSLLLGMGGSSLCPEVLAQDVRPRARLPRAARARLDRSGAGARRRERHRSGDDALHRVEQVGHHARAEHLQAVLLRARGGGASARSEAGTPLRRHHRSRLEPARRSAKADGFRHIFPGVPSIGGRYSALSDFGMVPAAAMGLDVAALLDRPRDDGPRVRPRRCRPRTIRARARDDPRRRRATRRGRDKLTIVASPGIARPRRLARAAASPSRPASTARASSRSTASALGAAGGLRQRPPVRLPAARSRARRRRRTRRWPRSSRPASRSCAIACRPTSTTSARSSSAGRFATASPARSSASTRSTSPTSRRARSRRAR